jgi:hypothetical protein
VIANPQRLYALYPSLKKAVEKILSGELTIREAVGRYHLQERLLNSVLFSTVQEPENKTIDFTPPDEPSRCPHCGHLINTKRCISCTVSKQMDKEHRIQAERDRLIVKLSKYKAGLESLLPE